MPVCGRCLSGQILSRIVLLPAAFLLGSPFLNAAVWRPVAAADLSATKCSLEPDADAEMLFRDVRLLNEASTFGYPVNVITEYVQLKIYTARGKDKYGTVQIPYWGKSIISGVEGRTIKPDGTILELGKDAIFDKVIEKRKGIKTKVVSFAMPGVEPGAVIEYRYMRNVGEFISRYVPLDVQTEFPTRELIFHVKPVSGVWVRWPAMRIMNFHCNPDKVAEEVGGFTLVSLHNIPAYHEEPESPPEYSTKQWILIYYEENDKTGKDKYWTALGRAMYAEYSRRIKVNGEVRNLANELTTGATSDDEKVNRLLEYCRANLKDVHGYQITTQERDAAKANRTTADTIERKEGTAEDINLAFAALASAAGFDARVARLADRSGFLFDPAFQSEYFLNTFDIAVKVNNSWKFYDVTNRNLPPGQLSWQEQGVFALIVDPKEPEFVQTPLLKATDSAVARIGNFTLSPDGALEGDIREIYSGNKAADWRREYGQANDAERENDLHEELKQRFAEFEISEAKFHVPADLSKGVAVMYHVKIEGYAQRTGKRLFLTPAFFEAGFTSRFTQAKRQNPIYFDYPWSETDVINIQLPEGYRLDHPDAPGSFNFPIGTYHVKTSITNTNKIQYQRELVFGSDKVLLFDAKAYPLLKQIFDQMHTEDTHMLTLKSATESAQLQ